MAAFFVICETPELINKSAKSTRPTINKISVIDMYSFCIFQKLGLFGLTYLFDTEYRHYCQVNNLNLGYVY